MDELTSEMAVRVARPTRDLQAAAGFYRDVLGLPVLGTFEDHDGFSGVILGLPDATRQLELVSTAGASPAPTPEDQLVLYLRSAEAVGSVAARLQAAGHEPQRSPNPYWAKVGAVCFVDPDGYRLMLSPQSWTDDR